MKDRSLRRAESLEEQTVMWHSYQSEETRLEYRTLQMGGTVVNTPGYVPGMRMNQKSPTKTTLSHINS